MAMMPQSWEAGLSNVYETFTWKESHPDSHAPTGEMIERAEHGQEIEIFVDVTGEPLGSELLKLEHAEGRMSPEIDFDFCGQVDQARTTTVSVSAHAARAWYMPS